jgi:hypothetical protein
MSGGEDFFDTNVVLYLLSADTAKADRAEELLALGNDQRPGPERVRGCLERRPWLAAQSR